MCHQRRRRRAGGGRRSDHEEAVSGLAPQQAPPLRQHAPPCLWVTMFCGNHEPTAEARRIPCPIDPSHSVSGENLKSHVKRCPFKKQAQVLENQPYYSKGINSGSSGDGKDDAVGSAAKRNAIFRMSVQEFHGLLGKIKLIHSAISMVLPHSYLVPDACSKWLNQRLDRLISESLDSESSMNDSQAFGSSNTMSAKAPGKKTKFLLSLGITEEEFHAMTWFTSWAVDADHSSELSDLSHQETNLSTM
ncbi:U11-48K-like CHHC zinc finger [Musa troglodytarum]|uniref:tRNA:m(4)X modification enzyme TRM13 n=1 Tax=Musa troglodytarum TaxID=320322 RepID=A0A9E7K3Z6_9LILI|nr:U11-48K-like CHHC zinc finger [Musa troglodytarum]